MRLGHSLSVTNVTDKSRKEEIVLAENEAGVAPAAAFLFFSAPPKIAWL